MKRLPLILLTACLAAPIAQCAPNPVQDLFNQAQAANHDRRYDDALRLYERILVEHPEEAPNGWFSAERSIAETLARKGDLAEAAKAAHLCLDAAPSTDAFNSAVGLAATILSALDQNVDRANQFLAFQQSGPKAGSVNPMDAVGYPSLPDRERAFESMRAQAGDTPDASRIRAYTFLLTGKPRDALAQFADAFRRSSSTQDLERSSQDLATVGLRAVRGHAVGLDWAVQFVIHGPDGPAGKLKTPANVADPFAQWLPAPPAPGIGGLAGLSADDLAVLRKVGDACRLYAGDAQVDRNLRLQSFRALNRIHAALDDWGAEGQEEWYLECAVEFNTASDVLQGLMAAARGRALHLGGAHAVLDELDSRVAAGGATPAKGMDRARSQLDAVCATLQKIHFPEPATKALINPARF